MPDAERPEPFSVAVDLMLPSDARFLEVARAFVAHIVRQTGFANAEAERVGSAVEDLVAGVAHHAYGDDPARSIEIHFRAASGEMQIDVAYAPSPGSAGGVERGLSGGSDPIVGKLRAVVDRIEFGEGPGREYCRLARRLPVGF